jgi:PAS domain S-box-containing protein
MAPEVTASEQLFRTVAEGSPCMIFINQRGRIVYANQLCVDTMGYTRDELCAPSFDFQSLIAPEYLDRTRSAFQAHQRGQEVGSYEYVIVTKEGRRIDAIISTKLVDHHGQPAILGMVTDITERKLAERRLAEVEQMHAVGSLAAGLAHEFNNLLMGVRGYTDLIDLALDPGHPARAYAQEIRATADRANEITRQLLLLGRRQPTELSVVCLNRVIGSFQMVMQSVLGRGVSLALDLAPDLGTVRGDRSALEQVLMNLVLNARDAMPQGGTLTLTTRNTRLDAQQAGGGRAGDYVALRVEDTGEGMDALTLSRVFEPFFTTKSGAAGSGLGLPIAYGIVKQHEGTITVESAPGKGSSFLVLLPSLGAEITT